MTKITWLYFLLGLVFVGAENGAADNMYMWGEGFAFFPQNLRGGGVIAPLPPSGSNGPATTAKSEWRAITYSWHTNTLHWFKEI